MFFAALSGKAIIETAGLTRPALVTCSPISSLQSSQILDPVSQEAIGGEMAARNSISVLGDHAGYWLRFVSNHVSHAFTRKVEARGVTVAEWVLLRELFDAQRTNPSQLADELGMTRGAISKLVERLCQKKLVARVSSHGDRRYQTVEITAAGKRIVPVLAKLADQNDREFFGHLRPEQKTRFLNVLRDIVRRHGWKDLAVN
jgi:DNA-binding MarR family transcriptional regulator